MRTRAPGREPGATLRCAPPGTPAGGQGGMLMSSASPSSLLVVLAMHRHSRAACAPCSPPGLQPLLAPSHPAGTAPGSPAACIMRRASSISGSQCRSPSHALASPVVWIGLRHLLEVLLPVRPSAADQAVPIPVLFLQDLLEREPQFEGLPRLLRPCRLVVDVAVLGECCHHCQAQQGEGEKMCSMLR